MPVIGGPCVEPACRCQLYIDASNGTHLCGFCSHHRSVHSTIQSQSPSGKAAVSSHVEQTEKLQQLLSVHREQQRLGAQERTKVKKGVDPSVARYQLLLLVLLFLSGCVFVLE